MVQPFVPGRGTVCSESGNSDLFIYLKGRKKKETCSMFKKKGLKIVALYLLCFKKRLRVRADLIPLSILTPS